jgi:hypothetical protein
VVLCQSYQEHGCFVAKVGLELLVPEACGRRVKGRISQIEIGGAGYRLDIDSGNFGCDSQIVGQVGILEITERGVRVVRDPPR